jgi:hypothetical protein
MRLSTFSALRRDLEHVCITNEHYTAVFYCVKKNMILVSLTSKNLMVETRRKVWKTFFYDEKILKFLFHSHFLIAVFFGGEKFSPNFKQVCNRPIYTSVSVVKTRGGMRESFELLSLKSEETDFSENRCAKSTYNQYYRGTHCADHWLAGWSSFGGPELTCCFSI